MMLTLDYHPLVNAVVSSWRSRLPRDPAGLLLQVTDSDLRELIQHLSQTIEDLAHAMDTETILAKLVPGEHLVPHGRPINSEGLSPRVPQ
jgi:hypothetical protein